MSNRPGQFLAPQRKPGAPLIVTAQLPGDEFAWANALRVAHFPPERNRLQAHVTLFHALPASVEAELIDLLKALSHNPAPQARFSGLINLGKGTAISIDSPGMLDLRGQIEERMYGLLSRQDAQAPRLHVTIQNKVTPAQARRLQQELGPRLAMRDFRFTGLALHAYEDGLWRPIKEVTFHR